MRASGRMGGRAPRGAYLTDAFPGGERLVRYSRSQATRDLLSTTRKTTTALAIEKLGNEFVVTRKHHTSNS
eukprot:8915710-Pyramimonas_sp.AAC.1